MKHTYIILASLLACLVLYLVEQVLQADYIVKTVAKILLFVVLPYLYIKLIKKSTLIKELQLRGSINQIKLGLIFGTASFLIVLLTYFLLQDQLNLDQIADELKTKSNVTAQNFILIGIYITFGNSFLEEFFFRGFIFLNLYESGRKRLAYLFSSVLFGVYHIAIFQTWFNVWLIGLALIGLIVIGLIFNWINTHSKNFLNSWIVHILADSAIILIGLRMFDII
ncbi:CPBP family intramembrane glutamic endopeptidase [Haloplasma contractile]|uniref:CAAX amino terminal protease family protein n=1 Tax=Haloplasma contractile SSD-17B TaxID=1033810 RepID=F7PTK4_9MOLU|nr:type II CAAX endopeptidase family protein [Haloplasma contractile]ERJ12164.1 CAAX amino terminal protease family protein [Haloplasma contractile SSD-17B]